MKLIRWFLCKLDIRHRLTEAWLPLKGSGLTRETAALWGSKVDRESVSYCVCRDCGQIIAPFEAASRKWHVSTKR
jgi:hypothetical protein